MIEAYHGLQNLVQRSASGPTQLDIYAGTYQYQPGSPRRLQRVVDGGNTIASSRCSMWGARWQISRRRGSRG